MGRWEPNAHERLEQAALELYGERGFDETTVKEIAERAGLTERTFFRYFADKREVLFPHANPLQQVLIAALDGVPSTVAPLDAVAVALQAAADLVQERGDLARQRQAVIAANPELYERELIKLAALASALAEALRQRDVAERDASLVAETGIAVFKVVFQCWVSTGADLAQLMRDTFNDLKALAKRE